MGKPCSVHKIYEKYEVLVGKPERKTSLGRIVSKLAPYN
jgi:hypothetical protein